MFDPVRAVFDVLESVPLPPQPIQLPELTDQKLYPSILRQRVQSTLSTVWKLRVPFLQPHGTPAEIAAALVKHAITKIEAANGLEAGQGSRNASVMVSAQGPQSAATVVDFGSGAGGPSPFIERMLNQHTRSSPGDGDENGDCDPNKKQAAAVPFILTDLRPHLDEWMTSASRGTALTFFPQPVDAADPPPTLIAGHGNGSTTNSSSSSLSASSWSSSSSSSSSSSLSATQRSSRGSSSTKSPPSSKRGAAAKATPAKSEIERIVLRTFHSSFEHLSNAQALRVLSSILHGTVAVPTSKEATPNGDAAAVAIPFATRSHKNTTTTQKNEKGEESGPKGGFLIITLNTRTLPTLLLSPVTAFFLSWVYSAILFSDDPVHLLLTYPVPIIPAMVAFDVFASSLRCKSADDIVHMAEVILHSHAKLVDQKSVDQASSIEQGNNVNGEKDVAKQVNGMVTDLRNAVRRKRVYRLGGDHDGNDNNSWTLETGRVVYLWPVASLEYVLGYCNENRVSGDSGSNSSGSNSSGSSSSAVSLASD